MNVEKVQHSLATASLWLEPKLNSFEAVVGPGKAEVMTASDEDEDEDDEEGEEEDEEEKEARSIL